MEKYNALYKSCINIIITVSLYFSDTNALVWVPKLESKDVHNGYDVYNSEWNAVRYGRNFTFNLPVLHAV